MALKKRKKKFSHSFGHGNFVVRITESRVDVEDNAKTWKQMFSSATKEYGMIAYLINENHDKELLSLCTTLFMTRLIFSNIEIHKSFREICEEALSSGKLPENVETVLAEERVLHEGTEDSIEDLENLKEK